MTSLKNALWVAFIAGHKWTLLLRTEGFKRTALSGNKFSLFEEKSAALLIKQFTLGSQLFYVLMKKL